MNVLLITYYWPPSGGSGVQRWLKFVKYLPSFNVHPTVYTVKNPDYVLVDESLNSEVPDDIQIIRERIWEPNSILAKFGQKEKQKSAGFLDAKPSFLGRKMQYIRANYFIPDARKFWIKPSVKKLNTVITENKIDVIITTGPPHSLHLIGAQLKKKTGVKWLADFRDPWTNIDYFHNLPLTEKAKEKHYELESLVLDQADAVTVVGKSMKEEFMNRSDHVFVLTNGFDAHPSSDVANLDEKFSICHIGMMNSDRNPKVFWMAIKELIVEVEGFEKDIQINLVGKCDEVIYQSVEEFGLKDYVNFIDYVPHNEVLKYQQSSQMLLISVNKVPSAPSIITGKIFEYLQSKRPILGIGPVDGDLAEILDETGVGQMVDFDDCIALKKVLMKYYTAFKSGGIHAENGNIERYHRKHLSGELVKILKNL